MTPDLCINFVPTGMCPTKAQTPHVPLSPQEIADEVRAAWQMGISMVHLHARDEEGAPTTSAQCYGRIISLIRDFAPQLVICVSLSGRSVSEAEQRCEPLQLAGRLKPDMGSLTLGSLNFHDKASINSPETIGVLASTMQQRGIKPELEIFDLGMINYSKYLIRKGLISAPFYYNLIFGNIAGAQASLLDIGTLMNALPTDSLWSLGGVGDCQLAVNAIAVACGAGVRVGLEDNIWFDAGRTRLATNFDLLRRVHELAAVHQRKIMSATVLRERLRLPPASR
ncbi:MAG: 3-keto-5-aminohexanoate cleavage protein [Syntrophobacteraceae bacterium]